MHDGGFNMILRFTKDNWERFFTHGKKSTFRIKQKKTDHYDVYGGSYYKPVKFGELDVYNVEGKAFSSLTEQDAKDDGFDSLDELKKEIKRFNPGIEDNRILWKHWTKNVRRN